MSDEDEDFIRRREEARRIVNRLDATNVHDEPERASFFNAVYEQAHGDAAFVPWADLKPKQKLAQWLDKNPGQGRKVIDIACGLGDNAEALAAAGYAATAFDLSAEAIDWARRRFPDTTVDYQVADLLDPPEAWAGGFDLVNECYTLQSVPPQMLDRMAPAVAKLVAPGGTLLVYARVRPDDAEADGPPWPLRESDAMRFADLGLELIERDAFEIKRPDRVIPHWFCEWRRPRA
jgi:SAM-dependent methyltransferase